MINKIKSYIGFAIRAGKVVFGYDNLIVSKKTPQVVLICKTQNDKVSNKIFNFCDKNNFKCVKLDFVLGDLIGRNCKVLAVLDKSLGLAILNELKMEEEK